LSAHPARDQIGIPERDYHQREIDEKGRERKHQADCIDKKEERCQQSRPSYQRHPKRNDTEIVRGFTTRRRDIKQLASSYAEQNQAACHLKIRYGDSKCGKDYSSEKYKSNRNTERRENCDETLSLALLARTVPSQTHKHGHQANSVYRDKNWNKGNEKLVDHVLSVMPEALLATDEHR